MLEEKLTACLDNLRRSRQAQCGHLANSRCLSSGPLRLSTESEPVWSVVLYPPSHQQIGCESSVSVDSRDIHAFTCEYCGAFSSSFCTVEGDGWKCLVCSTLNSSKSLELTQCSVVVGDESVSRIVCKPYGADKLRSVRVKGKSAFLFVVDCTSPHLGLFVQALLQALQIGGEGPLTVALVAVKSGCVCVYEFVAEEGVVSSLVFQVDGEPHQDLYQKLVSKVSTSQTFFPLLPGHDNLEFAQALKSLKQCGRLVDVELDRSLEAGELEAASGAVVTIL